MVVELDMSVRFNYKILEKIYYNFIKTRRVEQEIIKNYHPADKMKCPIHFLIYEILCLKNIPQKENLIQNGQMVLT